MAAAAALSAPACAGRQSEEEIPADTALTQSPEDKPAQLAARSQLEMAKTAQENYFNLHQTYAGSFEELKEMNPRLATRINVAYGDKDDFEISITASDSAKTVYIIRKSGGRVERRDGNGNPW